MHIQDLEAVNKLVKERTRIEIKMESIKTHPESIYLQLGLGVIGLEDLPEATWKSIRAQVVYELENQISGINTKLSSFGVYTYERLAPEVPKAPKALIVAPDEMSGEQPEPPDQDPADMVTDPVEEPL